jgi:hypothetical protein
MDEKYQEQIDRIIRGFDKMPRDPFLSSLGDAMVDDYYHLITDMYHLKDWLSNTSSLRIDQKELNKYIEKDVFLKKLQSLASGIKHLKITKKTNKYLGAKFIKAMWQNENDLGSILIIEFDEPVIATAFVIGCLNSWNKFLSNFMVPPFDLGPHHEKDNTS